MAILLCRPRKLPLEKLAVAERRAIEVNPENEFDRRTVELEPIRRGEPRRIAVVIARKWPKSGVKLSVSFLDGAKSDLRKRILLHMNAWGSTANVKFVETAGVGQVRIARLDSPEEDAGYWSYIGTEILDTPEDEPTLNLDSFTMRTPESEFRRVVRHEAGHTLGSLDRDPADGEAGSGVTGEDRATDAQGIEQGHGVGGEVRDAIADGGFVGVAVPALRHGDRVDPPG